MALFVLFAAVVLAATALHVAGQQGDQSGFLSIDCGLDTAYSDRRDIYTNILYVSDSPHVDGGENHEIAADQVRYAGNDRSLLTLRSFPSGTRTCYTLPTKTGVKYLVRMEFLYGNYDGKISPPSFELHLGSNYWDTYKNWDYWRPEAIFIAWARWVPVCLVNTGSGTPFVNTVELRPLQASLYPQVTADQSISTYSRVNMGANVTTR